MNRRDRFFVVFFSTILIISLNLGCAHRRHHPYSDAPGGVFINPSEDWQSPLLISKWSGPVDEYDKIDYLLGRLAVSPYTFIRNGSIHDGKAARQWLLYKMSHWVNPVNTAEDFIARVASYSQRTGKPYLVKFPDGRFYTVRSLLANELANLESRVAQLHQPAHEALSKASQVSLSAATVTTNVVATSTSS